MNKFNCHVSINPKNNVCHIYKEKLLFYDYVFAIVCVCSCNFAIIKRNCLLFAKKFVNISIADMRKAIPTRIKQLQRNDLKNSK